VELGNDPFFGSSARFLAVSQREQELKFEVAVEIRSGSTVACVSSNYHVDRFGALFGIRSTDGQVAYSSCL